MNKSHQLLWRQTTTQLKSHLYKKLNSLLPPRCCLCQQLITTNTSQLPLCQCCQIDLVQFDYQLGNYAVPELTLQPDIKRGLKHIQFDRLYSYAPYQWPFNHWISALKFSAHYQKAILVGQLLASRLAKQYQHIDWPQVILPMPIHPLRRLSRGYNQAELIGKTVAKQLSLCLDSQSLSRIKSTEAQTSLGQKARQSNVKNAFAFNNKAQYRHIALLDDVITTGSTVNEVCKILKLEGVTQIDVWTVCATPIKD